MSTLNSISPFVTGAVTNPRHPPLSPSTSSLLVTGLRFRSHVSSSLRHRRNQILLRALEKSEVVEEEELVEVLRVPESWMSPSNALKESEWLRTSLQKWLDDEYCPEDANLEISKVAAQSYYESLTGKTDDMGEILMNMVKSLQSVSFQESFHGSFSSANAAVHLITLKMESDSSELEIDGE
ncbi:hypothetical protein ZOSMA_74G00110 [Zostera marina]|uniref:Uncharacterized protein n=1 Tax=Zostera marina TaxID=29655 RepID=A0A0K9NRS4_ZOSMR|nr:hypothetical protein ZOSMA_74G00110 [Zostera marina]